MTASGDNTSANASPSEGHAAVDKAGDPTPTSPGDDDEDLDDEEDEDEQEKVNIRPEPLTQQNATAADVEAGLQLIELCREGHLDAVVKRTREGAPAGFITKSGWTPVAAAAYSGFNDILVYLLDIRADAMYETSAPWRKSQLANGMSALNHEKSPRRASPCNTPLHWACYKGYADTVALLLAAGYSLEAVDSVGNRCLHLACSGGHRDVVEQLLAHSAAVDARNQYGNRALELATEPACRRLLTRFQSQTACEWCKETFSRLRRPSLCQHCNNVFCDTKPCSSSSTTAPTPLSTDPRHDGSSMLAQSRSMRYCQECATEMGKAEQDLRTVLESKLELIRRTLAVIDPSINTSTRPATTIGTKSAEELGNLEERVEEGEAEEALDGDASAETLNEEAASDTNGNSGESVQNGVESPVISIPSEIATPNDDFDDKGQSSRSSQSSKRRAMPSAETILNALTLNQTDAEALYTALEAAQLKAADVDLLRVSKQTYRQLVAHVTVQEEIKALLAVRPIGIRSLLEPLKRALQHATREQVHPVMLTLAMQVIQSGEAECTLFGCHALCEKIERGSQRYSRDIARLEASLADAQLRSVSEKLLTAAGALRDRLNAEVRLEGCLLPFKAPPALNNPTGALLPAPAPGSRGYVFHDGTAFDTLLQALEYRSQLVTAAVDTGAAVDGVSSALLEEANTLLKQLKKDVRDEAKAEEERRKAEEEAALKAAKKGKKKTAKK